MEQLSQVLAKKGARASESDVMDALDSICNAKHFRTYDFIPWGSEVPEHDLGRAILDELGLEPGGYFLFAALKIRNCHGGPGRAIVVGP